MGTIIAKVAIPSFTSMNMLANIGKIEERIEHKNYDWIDVGLYCIFLLRYSSSSLSSS